MIIDRTHRPWLIATVAAIVIGAVFFVPYSLSRPEGMTGGSAAGLTYGIAAALLMLIAGLLGARRKVPGWRIGRMQTWMRAHLWLGFLALPLVFFHGGFSMGHATLARILMVLLLLVSISGVLGALLQHFLPREMTHQLPMETIYEQIGHVREQLREECEQLLAAAAKSVPAPAAAVAAGGSPPASPPADMAAAQTEVAVAILRDFYLNEIVPLLSGAPSRHILPDRVAAQSSFALLRTVTPSALRDSVATLEDIWEEARELARQEKLHLLLHGWLFVHVPLSYALLLLTAVHAFQALRY